jgi:serine/threonine protein kinase/tetratricopeptide (TPR) repeat protein
MGEVYRARDSRLRRDVAVKVMRDQRPGFVKEAQAAAALNHPNIVAIYDVGPTYVVMEIVEGETLRQVLRRGPMPFREVIETGSQIADGLAAAHAAHIVHRDLKPENIVIARDGRPKILDFGLAKRTGRRDAEESTLTEPGTIMGTAGYMSPEQVRGLDLDSRSDIFSLGLVLYEMLTGRRAFAAASVPETMAAIVNEPPAEFGSGVSPQLQSIVLRCIEKNPERRFHAARDLAFSLRSVSSERPGSEWPARYAAEGSIDSLAVIPFENMGGNPDVEYLSDGITESLINSLSRISGLRVVARSRVFRYKDKQIDAGQVGRELNVRALLTGRIAQRGESLRVQTELVEAATETQLWGERFHRRFVDIFEVEEEIAGQIARNLRLRLSGEDQSVLAGRYRGSSEAYQFFLQGQHHWKKRTGDSLGKALECFHQAASLDSHYAAAHEGIARCYLVLAFYNVGQPRPLLEQAKAAAARAVELDPRDPGARATRALLFAWADWDWPRANAEIQQALRNDTDDPQIHDWAAFVFGTQGRMQDALREIGKALELDPLALQLQHHAAWFFLLNSQFDRALLQTRKMIELDANYPLAYLWMGVALERLSRYGEAGVAFRKALELFGGGTLPAFESQFGHCLAVSGQQQEARQILEKLKVLSAQEYVEPYGLCLIHLGLGEPDKALIRLEEAANIRSVYASLQMLSDTRLDSLRSDPRFGELLARMHLGNRWQGGRVTRYSERATIFGNVLNPLHT